MNARIVPAACASVLALAFPTLIYAGGDRVQLTTAPLPIAEFGTLESTVLNNGHRTLNVNIRVLYYWRDAPPNATNPQAMADVTETLAPGDLYAVSEHPWSDPALGGVYLCFQR